MANPPSLSDVLADQRMWDDMSANPNTFTFPEAPQLVVTVAPWVPHVAVFTAEDGTLSIGGPVALTLNSIAAAMNFTYTLVKPPDGTWGLAQANGSWTGMVGQVYRKEADMGLGPFAVTYSRSTVVDFTVPILQDYFRILVKRGVPEPDPWGFLKPLTPYTWLGVLVAGLTLSVVLLMVIILMNKSLAVKQYPAVFLDVVFDVYGALVSQDLQVLTKEQTVYMLMLSWFTFCLVVMRSYAGALTSQLSVRYMPRPIKDLEGLVNHPTMKAALEIQTAFSDYVRTADSGLLGQLNEFYDQGRMAEVISPNFPTVMKEMVGSGEYVLLIDELTLLRLLSEEFSITGECSYYLAYDRFKPWILSFIGQQDHPLVPAISSRLLAVVESGLYMRWLYEQMPNATSCNSMPRSVSVSEEYSLQGLWGVFTLLAGGLILSSVVFLLELCMPQYRNMPSVSMYKISVNKVISVERTKKRIEGVDGHQG